MKVYLVRHGESQDSVASLHQRPNSPLAEEGLKQASLIAKRFKNIKIDIIISSPFERAKQTAEVIGKTIERPVRENLLFREIKRPTEIEGKDRDNSNVVKIKEKIWENYHNPDFRYSDEETFAELKSRAIKAIEYLEIVDEESVLIVTHGIITQMLLALVTFGKELTSKEFLSIKSTFGMDKVGLTLFEHSPKKRWRLVTWNDQAHLV